MFFSKILTGKIKYLPCKWQYLRFSSTHNSQQVQKTALYEFHKNHNGKLINFGGWLLPVQYADQTIVASHLYTRDWGSIFDVSHMLQTYIRGKSAIESIESVCTADVRNAALGASMLTCFLNSDGGILDDLIITKVSEDLLYIVSNAAMIVQDMGIMSEAVNRFKSNGQDVHIEFLEPDQQSLLAVQGPQAVATLASLLPTVSSNRLTTLPFMSTMLTDIAGARNCRITRCGYTGEDGVEISIPSTHIDKVTDALLNVQLNNDNKRDPNNSSDQKQLKLAGLGARDTLRLEAGLCLYGSDIDANVTPIEAGLAWLVAKRRRVDRDFPGAEKVMGQLNKEISLRKRRISLQMVAQTTKMPAARAGAKIWQNNEVIGTVTSGCQSPTLDVNIAMGFITKLNNNKTSGDIRLQVRDKFYPAIVTKVPFVKTNYFKKPNGK